MRHPYDTNKCKNIMKVITKYHPKDMMFYETCIAKARILAAIGKDSVGILSYLEMAFERLGIKMLETTREFGRVNDFESTYNKENKKTSASKLNRSIRQSETIREQYRETIMPKIKAYEHRSGMRMEIDKQKEDEDKRKQAVQEAEAAAEFALTGVAKKKVRKKQPCLSCGGTDHQRRNSKKCKAGNNNPPGTCAKHGIVYVSNDSISHNRHWCSHCFILSGMFFTTPLQLGIHRWNYPLKTSLRKPKFRRHVYPRIPNS
jgi:hypothetical protein